MAEPVNREEAIFEAVVELKTAEERAAFIARACGEDLDLRQRVESLLRAHEQACGFLDEPHRGFQLAAAAAGVSALERTPLEQTRVVTEQPGDRIGRYRLLQKIGEGGCGVVYMAEQEEPVRRRVALKIIKLGMDTKQVIARFEAERQALAMMDHPNIARVLDAGATDTGRPFFVMDLVRGVRITEYCDQASLSTSERLGLFIQVCEAIQHAHQKGIIHRDIKPSNILVSIHNGKAVPVIIDFGIAKATEQRLTNKTLFTAFEQFIGTPAYMSPEQAEMNRLDIDTRSDIYSLGVLLYELLTGRTPFDPKALAEAGLEQLRRTIREQEPLRPSTCLSTMLEADLATVARQHHTEPPRLINLLRGDLDWIVMKCLEKDRTRRYETTNALASDVQHYLDNEPVLARPPSNLYRLEKLVRRNKGAFVAGGAVALALVIGLAVSLNLYLMERDAYRRAVLAEQSQSRLRQIAEKARASEAVERRASQQSAYQSRLNSYAADINGAFLALQSGNLGRTRDLLQRQRPQGGEDDLRGFEWRYLWQQAKGDEQLSLSHPGFVSCAAFSADGQQLASACYDGWVRIWDLGSRRVVHSFGGFDQQYGWRYLAYSPKQNWLAGLRQGKLVVWDCSQNSYPVIYEQKTPARVIAFSPRVGRRLVGWGNGRLALVDTATWQTESFGTELNPASYPCLAIDQTGKLAALAHEGEWTIEIWDLDSGSRARLLSFPEQSGPAFVSLAWAPNGLLGATTWSGQLWLLDARSGSRLASCAAHTGSAFGLAFSNDAKKVVTAGHDQVIRFWSVPKLEALASLRGHGDEIWALSFSPDGQSLCTASKDGTAKIWSLIPKTPPLYITNWFAGEFSADGRSFVTLSDPATEVALDYWDLDNPAVRTTKTLPVSDVADLVSETMSTDARLLGVAKRDGTIELWNLESGKLVASARLKNPPLSAMAFDAAGAAAALGTEQGTVELWKVETGELSPLGARCNGRISSLGFSGQGRFLIIRARGQKEMIWDRKANAQLPIPAEALEHCAISPDDALLAAASTNYVVRIWELPSLRERAVLRGHRWTIAAVAFSPDGQKLATGSLDALARLWDVRTGREVTPPLRGHLQGITSLAFSADGRTLATGSTDQTVKLWHVPTGRELFSLSDASQPRFSPSGDTLLVKTSQGARLLHAPSLVEIDAHQRQPQPLAEAEGGRRREASASRE